MRNQNCRTHHRLLWYLRGICVQKSVTAYGKRWHGEYGQVVIRRTLEHVRSDKEYEKPYHT